MPRSHAPIRRAAPASLAILLGLAASGCGGENAYQAPPPPSVTAINPPLHAFAPYRDIVATVRPEETIDVRARVAGFLEGREFEPGDDVREGQLLFTLETAEYVAAVNGAEADLAAARARRQLDAEVEQKYQLAYDKGAASEVELLEAQAKVQVSTASVQQAEAKVERARLDLSYTSIHSPITGRIGEDLVSTGNLVGRGEPTLLARVSTIDPMNVYFDVSENAYLDFRRSMIEAERNPEADEVYPFEVVLPDGRVYEHSGTLDFVDIEIDRTTGTMRLRGVVPNPDGLLRDGLFVRTRIRQPVRDAIAVPASAVLVDMAGTYVYVVDGDGVVARQGVEVGVSLDGLTEVLKGVDASSTVVVDGILRARPGAKVTAEVVDLAEAMRRIDPSSVIAAQD
ncbi:MAG: efflux RND transporter periplasmic adaptor subunit [Planctomycetota bacterium]|nr:efflux RND transporter periplasmic adaptor subunit [Planctomycetota bacterium]